MKLDDCFVINYFFIVPEDFTFVRLSFAVVTLIYVQGKFHHNFLQINYLFAVLEAN